MQLPRDRKQTEENLVSEVRKMEGKQTLLSCIWSRLQIEMEKASAQNEGYKEI